MMRKPYIRIYGRYTAACENEKATVQFVDEHLRKEHIHTSVIADVISELRDWFEQNPEGNKTHTVIVNSGNSNPIIVSRILRTN